MKKLFALLLCLAMILSMFACGEEPQTATTEETKTESNQNKTEEQKETENKLTSIADPLTAEALAAIPIATDDMTSDQLRKICLDFMNLQVSFPYIPSVDYTYIVTSRNEGIDRKAGTVYGGLPYVTAGSGNLYRIMEFYDFETGVLNMDPFFNQASLFGNACSGGACIAWSRVVNSAQFGYTKDMTQFKGYVPVGPYQYPNDIPLFGENDRNNYDCKDVTKENGEQVMFQSYAKLLPADGIVSGGHVRMISDNPVVKYEEDGVTINGAQSYVLFSDQGLYNTQDNFIRTMSDGLVYRAQGCVNQRVSFAELLADAYLPFTFKEFLGTDPVEKAEVTVSLPADSVTPEQLLQGTLISNYNISDIFVVIKDANGQQKFRYAKRLKNFFTYQTTLDFFSANSLTAYSNQNCTIELNCQLFNGELITAYSASLV